MKLAYKINAPTCAPTRSAPVGQNVGLRRDSLYVCASLVFRATHEMDAHKSSATKTAIAQAPIFVRPAAAAVPVHDAVQGQSVGPKDNRLNVFVLVVHRAILPRLVTQVRQLTLQTRLLCHMFGRYRDDILSLI